MICDRLLLPFTVVACPMVRSREPGGRLHYDKSVICWCPNKLAAYCV
jgi:hypothetical protein